MRAVLQRVTHAKVVVDAETVGEIGVGWLVLLGVGPRDTPEVAATLADKIARLRAFADPAGKMNLSALDLGAEVLLVSQFTLYADLSRGRRPSFIGAAPPEQAEPLVEHVAAALRDLGLRVATGRFGAEMQVELVNDGPVTILLSTD